MRDQIGSAFLVLPFLAAVFLSAGCTPSFPREMLDQVDRHVTFRELLRDPDRYKGLWIMLGGLIVASRNVKEGTNLEVLQAPLTSDGRPRDFDESEGRFIVHSDKFLDPAVFHQGRRITVIGGVTGYVAMPFDEVVYQYPVLSSRALQLWQPPSGPRFFFGIGVSKSL